VSARAAANGLIWPIDFPLVIVGGGVLLILVVDWMLFIASVRQRDEAAGGGFLTGNRFIVWWKGIGRSFRRIPPAQVIEQYVRRVIRIQIWRFAPPSRFIKHGLAPLLVNQCRPIREVPMS
jgi:hypothetical protein